MKCDTFDIRRYLTDRLPGHFQSDSRGWLTGACLFHRDGARPNLGVNPQSGAYRCLSCGARGDRIALIRRIENFATYDEARTWFDETYGIPDDADAPIEFSLGSGDIFAAHAHATLESEPPDESILDQYRYRHPYLETRGIAEVWQRRFDVGYDRRSRTVTLPWRDRHGALVTVKHRSVADKRFWYSPRVSHGVKARLLFGLHHVARRRDSTVWICEGEIDALSLWQSGRPAVAIGGSHFSIDQARELALSGVGRVVLACDRDDAGRAAHKLIRERLRPYGVECVDARWPDGFDGKDVNDVLLAGRINELNIAPTGLSLGIAS